MKEPLIIQDKIFRDNRGHFIEFWNIDFLKKNKISTNFVQQNFSYSKKCGTVRGLHAQKPPYSQAKLVRCLKGKIIDIVIDIRKGSKNFGKCKYFNLSARNKKQLYVPIGFLHGFISLEDNTELLYMCSNYYSKKHEISINFFDNFLNIKLPKISSKFIQSTKDKKAIGFNNFDSPF